MFHSFFFVFAIQCNLSVCQKILRFGHGKIGRGRSLPIPPHIPPLVIATMIMLRKEKE
jgi:hypothetical protein